MNQYLVVIVCVQCGLVAFLLNRLVQRGVWMDSSLLKCRTPKFLPQQWNITNTSFTVHLEYDSINHHRQIQPHEGAALCAIVIHEEAYLDEWIDFHIGLGFTTIYLYDNSADFDLRSYSHRQQSHIQIRHFPGDAKQMEAYLDCAKTIAAANKKKQTPLISWVAFFDVDEFLVLRQHATVIDFLSDHCPSGQIGINWYMFHTSNEVIYRPLPVTYRFQYRDAHVNEHVKSIVRLDDMDMNKAPHAHFAHLKDHAQHYDSNKTQIVTPTHPGPFNPNGPTDIAVLHHYRTKSQKEYVDKTMRGRADLLLVEVDRAKVIAESHKLPAGAVWDDSAWELLKKNVPKYRIFEFW